MSLEVIGVGHGHVHRALEELGFGPVYHMREVFKHGTPHMQAWLSAMKGGPVDWHALFAGYRSTTDYPGAAFYPQLVDAFPQAKIILTVRDPEEWYETVRTTVWAYTNSWTFFIVGLFSKHRREMIQFTRALWNHYPVHGYFSNKEIALKAYKAYNEQVIKTINPNRLLVFHPDDGWEPLCTFLNVPIPDKPFPKNTELEAFKVAMRRFQLAVKCATWGVCVLVYVGVVWWRGKPLGLPIRLPSFLGGNTLLLL